MTNRLSVCTGNVPPAVQWPDSVGYRPISLSSLRETTTTPVQRCTQTAPNSLTAQEKDLMLTVNQHVNDSMRIVVLVGTGVACPLKETSVGVNVPQATLDLIVQREDP